MTDTDGQHIKRSIEDEAVAWHVKLTSGACSDSDITQHMEWMLEDPEHLAAYERVAEVFHAASKHEHSLREVFAADAPAPTGQTPWYAKLFEGWGWPQAASAAAAAAALLFFVTGTQNPFYDDRASSQYYTSTANEVRTLKLADGSRVSLFANTKLSVAFEDTARNIDLIQGRAFFDVVADKNRPFYVNTASRQVKVVGTRFEVVRTQAFDRISVNEGLVSVEKIDDNNVSNAPVLIEPGVSALYELDAEAPVLTEVGTESIGAWKDGILTFQNVELIEVITQIGQLFPEAALAVDDTVDGVSFSGTLVVSDAETMVRQLASFLSLDVTLDGAHITLTSE